MTISSEDIRTHPVVSALESADNVLASVRESSLFGLSDDDLVNALGLCEQLRARILDAELALVAETDARDLGRREGAVSTAAFLADRFRMRAGDARRLVEVANRTRVYEGPVDYAANVRTAVTGRELIATGAALAEGVISPEHVTVVARLMRKLPATVLVEQAREAERQLAEFCRQFDPCTVATLGECVLDALESDALDDVEAERHCRRELRFNESTGELSGRLTSEGMALVRTALDPLAAPNPAADGSKDERTATQRLADALVELARRAIAADGFETNHGVSHRVLVTIALDALAAGYERPDSGAGRGCPDSFAPVTSIAGGAGVSELAWGGAISAAAARRIACFAGVQRVVLDPMGAVLDVGREYRTATPAQFVALIARDGGCAFPGCTRPASWCIAHHIVHWVDGGETNLDNLVLLCSYHHTVVHHRGWDIQMGRDRLPNFYPPPWIDPARTPRRNTRPRLSRYSSRGRAG
ncbi:MAG TPA: DUF222 domain-containing protein [Jiangellaceae bacterium]|nr:DUF222 domain-containing protein [Jiangellaceae bacterium]